MSSTGDITRTFLNGGIRVQESWRDGSLDLLGEAAGARASARFVWQGEAGGWWRGATDREVRPFAWALRNEIAESNVDRDLLGRFASVLAGYRLGRSPRSRRHFPAEFNEFLEWGDTLAKRLVAPFSADAVHAAQGFPRGLRARLARRFTDDVTGRLRQMADSPGLILLWYGLDTSSDLVEREIAAAFVRLVIAGRKRDVILIETLQALLEHRESPQATSVDAAMREAYRWRRRHSNDSDASSWPLFVRKARATVDPGLLLRPPPIDFVPGDIPDDRVANARWYGNTALHDAAINPTAAGGLEVARAYGRLLSYVGAHETTARFAHGEVLAWLRAAPRRPIRRWSPDELYRRIRHPPRVVRPAAKKPAEAYGPRLGPLPPPPLPALVVGSERLDPLTTPYALEREGDAMSHCVGGYVDAVFAGRSYIYAGVVAGERLTVEVARSGQGWALRQARGVMNELPSPAAMTRLRSWCPAEADECGIDGLIDCSMN